MWADSAPSPFARAWLGCGCMRSGGLRLSGAQMETSRAAGDGYPMGTLPTCCLQPGQHHDASLLSPILLSGFSHPLGESVIDQTPTTGGVCTPGRPAQPSGTKESLLGQTHEKIFSKELNEGC